MDGCLCGGGAGIGREVVDVEAGVVGERVRWGVERVEFVVVVGNIVVASCAAFSRIRACLEWGG